MYALLILGKFVRDQSKVRAGLNSCVHRCVWQDMIIDSAYYFFPLQFFCPAGSPSGLPEIIGYLNGTSIQHLFNIKTFLGTFVSCVLGVAAGLFCGPEGPMVHLG